MLDLPATIRAIGRDDHQAFTRLYRSQRASLVVLANGLLAGDHGAAEDVVDAAFMAVWQGAGRFGGTTQGEARAWLRQILRHKAVDWLRANGRFDLGFDGDEGGADPAPDPEHCALAGDAASGLAKAMSRLSLDQREAVMLCYFEDLPLSDIAAIAGCPEGTVKTRLYHARLKLRRELETFETAH